MNHENMKMTEVGWIPKDWEVKTIGEVGKIVTGSTPPTADEMNYGHEFMFVSPADLGVTKYINRTTNYLSKKGFSISRQIPEGSILYTCIGSTIGKIGVAGSKLATNQQINAVIPFAYYNNEYVYYALQIRKQHIIGDVSIQAVPLINKSDFAEKCISIPTSPSEQRRIASVLSDTDSLIASLSRTIEKKRLVKQGAMQQLLTGKTRLKGFSGEWVEKELGEVCKIQRGSILKSSDYCYGPIPVIAGGMTPAGYHNVANREGRTITISASGANAGYVSIHNGKIFASDCSTISESNEYNIDFIYQFLLVNQQEIYRAQTGGAQPHIHPKDVAPMKIKMPDYNEQFAISERLRTMDNEIASLEAELQKYKFLKQGMMQKLLTGQIRLVNTK